MAMHNYISSSNETKKKHPGGRPGLADPRKLTLSTKLNREEMTGVLRRIRHSGLKRSEALRLLVLNEDLPQVVHAGIDITSTEAYRNLQPLQSNLNQIAHILNSDRTSQLDANGVNKIVQFVRAVELEVKTLRQEIVNHKPGET